MTSLRKNLLVGAVGVITLLGTLPAWAATRTITCYSDVFAPFVTLEGSEIRGIDVDAIAEAGRRVGIKVKDGLKNPVTIMLPGH